MRLAACEKELDVKFVFFAEIRILNNFVNFSAEFKKEVVLIELVAWNASGYFGIGRPLMQSALFEDKFDGRIVMLDHEMMSAQRGFFGKFRMIGIVDTDIDLAWIGLHETSQSLSRDALRNRDYLFFQLVLVRNFKK